MRARTKYSNQKQNNLFENKAFSQVLTHGLPFSITSMVLFILLDFLYLSPNQNYHRLNDLYLWSEAKNVWENEIQKQIIKTFIPRWFENLSAFNVHCTLCYVRHSLGEPNQRNNDTKKMKKKNTRWNKKEGKPNTCTYFVGFPLYIWYVLWEKVCVSPLFALKMNSSIKTELKMMKKATKCWKCFCLTSSAIIGLLLWYIYTI